MRPNRLTGISYDEIQLFERVASNGSIAAGAREIGVSPSSASRRLAVMEDAVGARLFNRSTRRLGLTEAGQAALAWAQGALVDLDAFADDMAAATGQPSGRVRLAAPHFGMNTYLPAVIARFSRAFPNIGIDITTTDDLVSLIDGRFDVAVHYGTLPDSRMVAVRVANLERMLCAGAGYVVEHGLPETLQDLLQHNCIAHRQNDPVSWCFRRGGQLFHQPIRAKVDVDNSYCMAGYCLENAGIARLSRSTAGSALDAGQLIEVLPEYQCVETSGDTASLWIVHVGHQLPYRARLLVDHLKREIPAGRRAFYGT